MNELFVHKGKPVAIHELYEHALNNIDMFSPIARDVISKNIASLEWLDEMLEQDRQLTQIMIDDTVGNIDGHTGPVDLLSFSALVYKGKQRGYNMQPLIDAMNSNGNWLMLEQIKGTNESSIN